LLEFASVSVGPVKSNAFVDEAVSEVRTERRAKGKADKA